MKLSIKPQENTLQHRVKKRSLLGATMLSLVLFAGAATAQNFPHIKTFGFDYVPLNNRLAEATWLAKHHDWIVGGGNEWDTRLYNTIKEANPDTKIMRYLAYHSISPTLKEWMEGWASDNGYNPEDIYYHYHTDSEVRILNGTMVPVPGYGINGSASSLEEARAIVRWNGGWTAINPSSTVFRRAFEAFALDAVSVIGSPDTFLDGIFLDTFDGIPNSGNWSSALENTIELNPDGTRNRDEVYAQARQDLLDAKIELEAFLKQHAGNSFVVNVNAADADMVYQWFPDIYMDNRDKTMHLTIEYLVTSASGTSRIPRLRDVYDDLENGREMLIRSQTNYAASMRDIPYGFTSFILATHYLINHQNAYFMYHEGSAANYGGTPYGNFQNSHWHKNMEVNIGVPITRTTGTDYWGAPNTDRFYELEVGSGYRVLAREYSNALVLAKFGRGGFDNIGNNPVTHQLGGEYYPLLEDNTTGPAVTSVTLGESEGIILLKQPTTSSLPRPQVTDSNYEIRQ